MTTILLPFFTKIIERFQDEKRARDMAEKHVLAVDIERLTKGRMRYKELMEEPIDDLEKMRRAIDSATPKDFVSVSRLLKEADARRKPELTVGEWDPDAKKYKGGT